MSKLTFDDVMSFYPKHNRAIYQQILSAQKSGSLVPFVGAGLSVFCGYKLWGSVLRELAEFIPTDEEQQKAITQINSYEYEKAAQTILDAYPPMLDQLPTIVSSDKLHVCSQDAFKTSAAYSLPYLFPKGLIITTNFDRVLETIYLDRLGKSIQVVTPKEQDRLAQLRQNQALGLFKLHGDIGGDTVSIDDLVFTGDQYQQKYMITSPLVQELTRWFENRRLLFLGCSLNVDRTMEVLKQVAMSQSGIRHYAIIGCQKSDIPNRLKELSSLGILPIFYDSCNHDAIRIVLERLLEDTNSTSYSELRKASWVAPAVTKEEQRLLFDSDYFEFTGREKELQGLEDFCVSDGQVMWWAVTGPGGMGKSRLVYEFSKRKQLEGWKIARFEARPSRDSSAQCLDQLETWTPDTDQTIVVLDDVQAYMESVCRWLERMNRHTRSEKLRILLLEREGKDLSSASWLDTDPCSNFLDEWVYDEKFIYLNPMDDQSIMTIMRNYANAAGKTLNPELLLKTLDKVDPNLKRPLYAIAIADARCQGKDPTNWDRKEILDTLLKRELKFHYDRLFGISDRKIKLSKTLQSEIELLFAYASVHDPLPINKIPMDQYKTLNKLMDNFNMDPEEFFERLGVLRNVKLLTITVDKYGNQIDVPTKERQEIVISLFCPDLIKEHLVLNLALRKGKIDLLFPDGWQGNPGHMLFLRKILADHHEYIKDYPIFSDTVLNASPAEGLPAWIYCDILWGYTVLFDDLVGRTITQLCKIYEEHGFDPQIACFYSKGLSVLTYKGNSEECVNSVDQLEALYIRHSEEEDIITAYAKGLYNLSAEDDKSRQDSAVVRLEKLYAERPTHPYVVRSLADSIFNRTLDQSISSKIEAVERIEELCKTHPEDTELAARLIKAFSLLLHAQEPKDRPATLDRLEKFYALNAEHEVVQHSFAGSLVTIALVQETEIEVRKTLSRSLEFLEKYPDNNQIQLSYAMTCFNLTLVQQPEDIATTVSDIIEFLERHTIIIPEFIEALDKYLVEHPEHTERYSGFNKLH